MADVTIRIRTNYFSVTDPDTLRELIASVKTDGVPLSLAGKDGEYMFYGTSDILGVLTEKAREELKSDPDWADDNPDEAWSMGDFLTKLQALVRPGDACIVKSVGYEAMRSIFADAYIVTADNVEYVGFDETIRKKARGMLGNGKWDTLLEG